MLEIGIILLLVALNGVFALSELAIVSARRVRLKNLAEQGRAGAAMALRLSSDPGRFLSTVQIGITLIGILAGAFSGATLGARLSAALMEQGISERVAEPLGFGLVVALITYLSLVIGELVPKQLALRNAETIACMMAAPMALLSRVAAPVVWLLDLSTKAIFRLIGQRTEGDAAVTEEEVRTIIAEAESSGAIETGERAMIAGVLRLGDRVVRGLMTPRTEVDWINLDADPKEIERVLLASPHARLPACEGQPDEMIGVVQARDLLADVFAGRALDVRRHLRKAPIVPDTADALDIIATLRSAEVPMALVHDEYGHFEGIVTPADVLDAIAGAVGPGAENGSSHAVQREDGSWLIAGAMPADEMADLLGLKLPPERPYETVAGFVLAALGEIPATGDSVVALGWRFEVVDMDGRRIDKLLVARARV